MATIQQDQNLQEEEQGKPKVTAPVTQVSATGATQQAAQSPGYMGASKKPPGSGRFTNIQDYIQANKGAGKELAKGIGATTTDTAASIREGIEKAKGIGTNIAGEKARIGGAQGYADQIVSDPTQLIQDPSAVQDITKLREGKNLASVYGSQLGQYTGQANTGLGNLQNLGQDLKTETGRFDTLKNTFGNQQGYSLGEQRLDQIFLQADPTDPLSALQRDLSDQVRSGTQELGKVTSGIGAGISGIEAASEEAKQLMLDTLGTFGAAEGEEGPQGELGKLYGSLEEAEQQAQEQQEAQYEDWYNQIASGQITSKNLAEILGLEAGGSTYGLDLASSLDIDPNLKYGDLKNNPFETLDLDFADVISDEQQARLDALTQLSGLEEGAFSEQLGEKDEFIPGLTEASGKAFEQAMTYAKGNFESDTGAALQDLDAAATAAYAQATSHGGGMRARSAIGEGTHVGYNLQQAIKNAGYDNISDMPAFEAAKLAEETIYKTLKHPYFQNKSIEELAQEAQARPGWAASFGLDKVLNLINVTKGYDTVAYNPFIQDNTLGK